MNLSLSSGAAKILILKMIYETMGVIKEAMTSLTTTEEGIDLDYK